MTSVPIAQQRLLIDLQDLDSRLARLRHERKHLPVLTRIEAVIERVRGLLAGGRDDLADIPLDLDGQPAFNLRVYEIARAITPGETSTYGEVAKAMGEPGAARAVGKALGDNPWPIVVPCHRVLGASGNMGGFSAPGGAETKARLLTLEKARTDAVPTLFDLEFSVAPRRGG